MKVDSKSNKLTVRFSTGSTIIDTEAVFATMHIFHF